MKIKIIGLVNGGPTPFDGKYVKEYDPSYWPTGGTYDGGRLEVTSNKDEALQFATLKDAISKYREPFGIRPDGEPNRPLTAFSAEFEEDFV